MSDAQRTIAKALRVESEALGIERDGSSTWHLVFLLVHTLLQRWDGSPSRNEFAKEVAQVPRMNRA